MVHQITMIQTIGAYRLNFPSIQSVWQTIKYKYEHMWASRSGLDDRCQNGLHEIVTSRLNHEPDERPSHTATKFCPCDRHVPREGRSECTSRETKSGCRGMSGSDNRHGDCMSAWTCMSVCLLVSVAKAVKPMGRLFGLCNYACWWYQGWQSRQGSLYTNLAWILAEGKQCAANWNLIWTTGRVNVHLEVTRWCVGRSSSVRQGIPLQGASRWQKRSEKNP